MGRVPVRGRGGRVGTNRWGAPSSATRRPSSHASCTMPRSSLVYRRVTNRSAGSLQDGDVDGEVDVADAGSCRVECHVGERERSIERRVDREQPVENRLAGRRAPDDDVRRVIGCLDPVAFRVHVDQHRLLVVDEPSGEDRVRIETESSRRQGLLVFGPHGAQHLPVGGGELVHPMVCASPPPATRPRAWPPPCRGWNAARRSSGPPPPPPSPNIDSFDLVEISFAADHAGIGERDDTIVHTNADAECHDDLTSTAPTLPSPRAVEPIRRRCFPPRRRTTSPSIDELVEADELGDFVGGQ